MNDNGFAIAARRARRSRAGRFRIRALRGLPPYHRRGGGRRAVASPPCSAMLALEPTGVELYAVLADERHGLLRVGKTTLDSDRFPSLTPDCPQVHLFEREIAEQYGVCPEGHPWLKPVRFHASYRPGHDAWGRDARRGAGRRRDGLLPRRGGGDPRGGRRPGPRRRHRAGPLPLPVPRRAGLPPGDLARLPAPRRRAGARRRPEQAHDPHHGDGRPATPRSATPRPTVRRSRPWPAARCPSAAQALRGIALELERLANHTGDLGALAGDVGFLPTASYCGRLRGDFLNLTALLCGSRFGRGLVRPGGVGFDLDDDAASSSSWNAWKRRTGTWPTPSSLLWDSASVQARFEETGTVSPRTAVASAWSARRPGPAASSATCASDFPSGIFRFAQVPVSTWHTGDVFARAYVRWLEIQRSVAFIRSQLPSTARRADRGPKSRRCKPDHLAVSAGRRLARRDLPRGAHRRRRPVRALQDRGPVVPQLDRPGDGAARPADLRLPAVQQELQPVVLRPRPVKEKCICCESLLARSEAGPRTIAVPGPACRPCRTAFAGCRSSMRPSARTGAVPAPRPARPTPSADRRRRGFRLDLGRCLFCTDCVAGLPGGSASATARNTAWPSRKREDLVFDGRTLKLAEALDDEDAPALRPVAEAAAGQRRRVQRLRGRPERARARSSSTWAGSASSSWPRRGTPTAWSSPGRSARTCARPCWRPTPRSRPRSW